MTYLESQLVEITKKRYYNILNRIGPKAWESDFFKKQLQGCIEYVLEKTGEQLEDISYRRKYHGQWEFNFGD